MGAEGRLAGKVAIVVGGGQTPGDTIGNGRATAILFAREGARVLVVDRRLDSAAETVGLIQDDGGEAQAHEADIVDPAACAGIPDSALAAYGQIDVLHNNVGIGTGDGGATSLGEDAWDRIFEVNLKAMWRTCKAVLPVMRAAGRGSIVNVSSIASIASVATTAYKLSKAGVNALTEHLAAAGARDGVRVNAILPGLMHTPMAVQSVAAARGIDPDELVAQRDAAVPLGRKMGTGWDVAYAAVYLASDEARFVTGVLLKVDGGQTLRRG